MCIVCFAAAAAAAADDDDDDDGPVILHFETNMSF